MASRSVSLGESGLIGEESGMYLKIDEEEKHVEIHLTKDDISMLAPVILRIMAKQHIPLDLSRIIR